MTTHPIEYEYQALREELVKRIELRTQMIVGTIATSAIFLVASFSEPRAALIYPMISASLFTVWVQLDIGVGQIAEYIKNHLEPVLCNPGWQKHRSINKLSQKIFGMRLNIFAALGIFIVPQIVALILGLSATFTSQTYNPPMVTFLFVISLVALALSLCLLYRVHRLG